MNQYSLSADPIQHDHIKKQPEISFGKAISWFQMIYPERAQLTVDTVAGVLELADMYAMSAVSFFFAEFFRG